MVKLWTSTAVRHRIVTELGTVSALSPVSSDCDRAWHDLQWHCLCLALSLCLITVLTDTVFRMELSCLVVLSQPQITDPVGGVCGGNSSMLHQSVRTPDGSG